MSETKLSTEPGSRGYGLKVASATAAATFAAGALWASENMPLGHAERWQDVGIAFGVGALVLAGTVTRRRPNRKPEPRASFLRAGIDAASRLRSRLVEAAKTQKVEAPAKAATPDVSPLDAERERRRKAKDAETNQALGERAASADAGKAPFGVGQPTGFISNVHSIVAMARELVPSFKSNLTDILDPDADAATRISGAISFGLKSAAIVILGYFVYPEVLQFRGAAYKAWAEACIARQQAEINYSTMSELVNGAGTKSRRRLQAPVKRHSDFLGLALLTGLAVALMGGGVALVASGLVNAWELTAILSIGGVLVAAASRARRTDAAAQHHGAWLGAPGGRTGSASRRARRPQQTHRCTTRHFRTERLTREGYIWPKPLSDVTLRNIRIPRRALRRLLDFPVGRREETNAVRHAREPEQAGSFGEPHQLLRQIERAADLTPARAFAALAFRRPAFARRGRKHRRLSGAPRHPVRRRQIVRREALHDARIGEEGFPAFLVKRLELIQILANSGDLHLVAAHQAERVFERREMAEGGHFVDKQQGTQAARPIERAQQPTPRRVATKRYASACVRPAGSHRPSWDALFQLAKIHALLFLEILAHRRREYPARLRVGGRTDARQLV